MKDFINNLMEKIKNIPFPLSSRCPVARWWEKTTGEPLKNWEKIFGVVLLIVFLFVFYIALDANKFKATVRVVGGESVIGLNPTTELLDFGDLSRGTSAVRRVEVKNDIPLSTYVVMFKTGEIGDLIDISKNFFRLKPREETKIEYSVYMPASAEIEKTYDGRVYLFKIPLPVRN